MRVVALLADTESGALAVRNWPGARKYTQAICREFGESSCNACTDTPCRSRLPANRTKRRSKSSGNLSINRSAFSQSSAFRSGDSNADSVWYVTLSVSRVGRFAARYADQLRTPNVAIAAVAVARASHLARQSADSFAVTCACSCVFSWLGIGTSEIIFAMADCALACLANDAEQAGHVCR